MSARVEPPAVLLRYVEGLRTHDVELVASTVSDDLVFIAATRRLDKAQFLAMLGLGWTAFNITVNVPFWPVVSTWQPNPLITFQLDAFRTLFCIFPAMFLVILGPGVIQALKVLSGI